MSKVSYKSIREEVKIVTDYGSIFYITIDYDSEFQYWTACINLNGAGNSRHSALTDLLRQCKELSYAGPITESELNIDNTDT